MSEDSGESLRLFAGGGSDVRVDVFCDGRIGPVGAGAGAGGASTTIISSESSKSTTAPGDDGGFISSSLSESGKNRGSLLRGARGTEARDTERRFTGNASSNAFSASFSSSSELAKNGGGMGGIWDMVTVEARNALIQRDLLRDATPHVIA